METGSAPFFDTVRITVPDAGAAVEAAAAGGANLRRLDDRTVTVALDETTELADVDELLRLLNGGKAPGFSAASLADEVRRTSENVSSILNAHVPRPCLEASMHRLHVQICAECLKSYVW